MILRCTPRGPSPGVRKIGTGASALGAGLVVSLEEWILECEEHKFRFSDFNYSTQIP